MTAPVRAGAVTSWWCPPDLPPRSAVETPDQARADEHATAPRCAVAATLKGFVGQWQAPGWSPCGSRMTA
ncbi:hypothetical protein GCM10025868_40660 [Angustibacter aerolatus]|uniref:Uncharacterized protein n=1 Tax=Angustibacter aerolatus TaxID=1162965 RepID=A0ABQ6JMN4_9ACTN|nr:hypothetical protein [Angustibacter aerolatus]GMA88816.1 hypothetical protein GCM10025868_40660 [Angustibacter aerolatus]